MDPRIISLAGIIVGALIALSAIALCCMPGAIPSHLVSKTILYDNEEPLHSEIHGLYEETTYLRLPGNQSDHAVVVFSNTIPGPGYIELNFKGSPDRLGVLELSEYVIEVYCNAPVKLVPIGGYIESYIASIIPEDAEVSIEEGGKWIDLGNDIVFTDIINQYTQWYNPISIKVVFPYKTYGALGKIYMNITPIGCHENILLLFRTKITYIGRLGGTIIKDILLGDNTTIYNTYRNIGADGFFQIVKYLPGCAFG
ncbi:MAG: hypothetical protein J7K21_06940 [Desulfurococcales archaeon]|nr:hypothetical protein [Desulfurococcales archaeon]